jgi:4-hydroxybenzoate polyprenyltransferase/phosphoserine phosphatase
MNAKLEPAEFNVPLCVDLDGTLTRTDTLAESLLGALRRRFWLIFALPFWLLRGKSALKAALAKRFVPDAALLPYNEELRTDLQAQHAAGRKLILVTAADAAIASSVAAHLKIFDRVISSDGRTNLKSASKAQRLVQEFGERGFDYVGDTHADIPVWAAARHAFVVRPRRRLERALARRNIHAHKSYDRQDSITLKDWARLLRLHQWLKNALVFVPLVTSLSIFKSELFAQVTFAFVLFGMVASSVYIVNDLLDLPSDRRHARKRLRPFASGRLSPWLGFVVAPLLLLTGFALSYVFMPAIFTGTLALYLVMTSAYSVYLKQALLVDVMVLAMLYTLRIIAGAFAVSIVPSFWLLAFSMFLFLSLALIKRFTELQEASEAGQIWIAGRAYRSTDLRLLMSLGTSAGYGAVLVLALYINSDAVTVLYERPQVLWMLCPLLLYWIARMWMQAERSKMHDDPLVFAAKDGITHAVVAIGAIVVALAAWPLPQSH